MWQSIEGRCQGDAALVSVVCHPALHSLGSTGRDKTACWSIMNMSGWWIHCNNIIIGSTHDTLYLSLSFSMVMHCVESCYFFFLLVLSDADNSGGEKSRSKIMLSDSLVWVNYRCQETRACAVCVCVCVCVCVRDTQSQRQKERERERGWEAGKGWKEMEARLLWKHLSPGVKSLLGYLGNSWNIQIYLYSPCSDCLLQQRVENWKLLFAAPNGLSIWKMTFRISCFSPLLSTLPWLPLPRPLPHHSPCGCSSLLGTLRCNLLADCCFSVEGKQNEKTPHPLGENIGKWCDW